MYNAAISKCENAKRPSTGKYHTHTLDSDKPLERFIDYMSNASSNVFDKVKNKGKCSTDYVIIKIFSLENVSSCMISFFSLRR